MPFLDTRDGTSLFYRDWGTGRPVLFCSAWGLSSTEFQYQMGPLVDSGLRTIAFDRRSHGRSDDPGRGYDYNTLADDLAAVLDHLDLHDVMLVGHSMGCGEIVRYLTRHGSARVDRIVLIGAVLPLMLAGPNNPAGLPGVAVEEVRASWRRDFGVWLSENAGAYFGDGLPGCAVSQPVRDWTLHPMIDVPLRALIECNRTVVETDFRAELPAITVPALIIHGDHDASVPVEISGHPLVDLLPHGELVIYENGPHGLYLTHSARLTSDLLAFATAESAGVGPETRSVRSA
ncbi:MAG: alpha/beta hydrolase [Nocardia sp.]|uniref:alpha/beta fold hydrolase n=1 Tax=Nocardia sp. TaxID=1821 RepID=UPI0026198B8D|nr:alpha/beta hydrolase [Nocardia sp.]MCU1641470.1 alpha/beta hydrolase [Nocardia sp.]